MSEKARILLVDDMTAITEGITPILQSEGFEVLVADDGLEAMQALAGPQKIDLVVLDYAMPEMSGDQLASAIKRISPATPIIMVTGFGDLISVTNGKPPGVDLVVGKPVQMEQLRQAIAALTVAGAN